MATDTIDHSTLAQLVQAKAVNDAHVVGDEGGWKVKVTVGLIECTLTVRRGQGARIFKKMDTLISYLTDLGLTHFDVNAEGYAPAKDGVRRADRADALRAAHAAAAHDRWFREQVQASIDDPRPSVPEEEVRATFAARKAALRQRTQ